MILAIVGPTGVGKTKASVALAHKYNAIIINCDAMQVYKYLDIGTAKVTEEEKENVPHLLFDIKEPNEDYTIYDYQKDVRQIIKDNPNRNIILVGGTGLYLKAALYDYRLSEETNSKPDYSSLTNEELYNLVLQKDPNTKIHPNNRIRLERYLNKEQTEIVEPKLLYPHLEIGLTTDRDILYDRINKRVDIMLENGLLEEVKKLYNQKDISKPLKNGIGYKELFAYLDKEITYEEAIDNIKKNSRHYAKRQYTFFNNQLNVKWFNVNFNNFNETINEIINYIDTNNKCL